MHIIQLNYHNITTEFAQEQHTFKLQTDLMIDHDVYSMMNSCNTLIIEQDREAVLAVLYLGGHREFTVELL